MKISQARRPPGGAVSSIQRSPSTRAPRSLKASRWASRRRRPMKSPPGGGIRASPKRASSGPASRNEARIRLESSSSTATSETPRGAEPDAVVGDPGGLDPEPLQQRDLGLGVADPRHPVQQQLLLGQQAGGEDRQRRVLVAGDGQLSGERRAPFDDEFLHGSARVTTGMGRGWKIAIGVVVGAGRRCSRVNALLVDGETKPAAGDRARRPDPRPARRRNPGGRQRPPRGAARSSSSTASPAGSTGGTG